MDSKNNIYSLNLKLKRLRDKWKNGWPKNMWDKRYIEFRTDKLIAENIKIQIKKIEAGEDILIEEMSMDQILDCLSDIV